MREGDQIIPNSPGGTTHRSALYGDIAQVPCSDLTIQIKSSSPYKMLEDEEVKEGQVPEMILEYKVDGMTCVACSRTLENAMITEF